MPTIGVDKEELFDRLGRTYTTQEFDELCFEFGIELDEDTTEDCQPGERPQLKIEIPANRYDMLCIEGIARALNVFLGKAENPKFKVITPKEADLYTVTVEKSVEHVRPYIAGAILRGVKFTKSRYESFISLQDKLHSNLCRNRTLVAIGTHDLDKVTGKHITYKGFKPEDIKFAPLNQTKEMTGTELMEFYDKDKNIGKFLHIIRDSPVYPVFIDESGQVLSLPPIINSEHTKITLDTKNVFIDLSGTDVTKLEVVVHQMVAMFAEYCDEPFSVEQVKIISEHNGQSRMCPSMAPRIFDAEVDYINSCLGLKKTPEEICKLLDKMGLDAKPSSKDSKLLEVTVPVTRSDVLHQCDIMEDAGIAYGYNNLVKTFPSDTMTLAEPLPIMKLSDIFRKEAAMATWSEIMPLTLCSIDENFDWLKRKDVEKGYGRAVYLANPKTVEYQVVRTSLLPGLLKSIRENRKHSLPLKVFETGDIVIQDPSTERKAINKRHFAAVYAGKVSGFEIVQGLLDRLMKMLRVPFSDSKTDERGYWITESDIPTYFKGRGAEIHFQPAKGSKAIVIGSLGVLHPEVMNNFEIPYVGSAVEFELEPFL